MDRQPSGRPGLALPFCSRSREKGPLEDDRTKLQAVGCAFGKLRLCSATLQLEIDNETYQDLFPSFKPFPCSVCMRARRDG